MPRLMPAINSATFRIVIFTLVFVFGLFNGGTDAVSTEFKERLGIPLDMDPDFQLIATSPNRNYSEEDIQANAPDILSLEAVHIGAQRLLFRVTFAHPVRFNAGPLLHFYLDLDDNRDTGRQDSSSHRGVDVMMTLSEDNISISTHNPNYRRNDIFAGGIVDDDQLYVILEAPLHGDSETIVFTVHLLAERWFAGKKIGQSDNTTRQTAHLARQTINDLPPLDRVTLSSLAPLSAYRYFDAYVRYEALDNKGLTYGSVAPSDPLVFGRQRPEAPFVSDVPQSGKMGTVARHSVPVHILEEAGVERRAAPVTFGFPLPQGAVYSLDHFRLLSPASGEVPAQFTATAFWPDASLKWVLVDFTTHLVPKEDRTYWIEFGHQVRRSIPAQRSLVVTESDQHVVVTTGPLQVQINKNSFNLFESVWFDADGDGLFQPNERVASSGYEGVGMVGENGTLYTTSALPPESVRIEESGSEKVVIRVEGQYASEDGEKYMRYVTRLTFRADSTKVNIAHTHINDYLETEFTDITSLYLPIETPSPITRSTLYTSGEGPEIDAHCQCGPDIRMFLIDEKTAEINEQTIHLGSWTPGGFSGVIRAQSSAGAISAVIHDFQERWPKGLAADSARLTLELLPEQPDAEFGTDLPFQLMFPFVSGKYRFKWGNSITERITIDFGGTYSAGELAAEGRLPIVAVIPAQWYDKTEVLGPIPVGNMDTWDRFVSDSYADHLTRKRNAREFGYFNYGDWFGERGRNWGNNEYDLAHGFFMEFIRTGDRRYHRLALAAARHQADVDIIHAYPDPAFIGGNVEHAVAHTGTWTQNLPQGTWSKAYDASYTAANGHTWADGMVDAWYLVGDARVMEAALTLGEHIIWSMAPNFTALGTHERSAGWSLKALMALYRVAYDPEYLEAADHIATVALQAQDMNESGAWPHPLPTGHSGGEPGAVGNNLFLIGVLLGGLQSYHIETNDPAVRQSLEAAVNWVLKSWDPQLRGWPYSARTDGTPLYVPSPNLNSLIVPAVAYVGELKNDPYLLQVAEQGLNALVQTGRKGDGKSIAMALHFAIETLGRIEKMGY